MSVLRRCDDPVSVLKIMLYLFIWVIFGARNLLEPAVGRDNVYD